MKTAFRKVAYSGFTLLELLVVISIISILVAILTVNFTEARKSSRDEVRKSDLKALQLSIELYKSQNGTYPDAGCSRGDLTWTGQSSSYGSCANYIDGLLPEYIAELSNDPNGTGDGYIYRTDGSSYKLMAKDAVENKTITSFTEEFSQCPYDCSGVSGASALCQGGTPPANTYAVYSAGAECW